MSGHLDRVCFSRPFPNLTIMADPYSQSLCKRLISAFFYQKPLIRKQLEERIASPKKTLTRLIPDMGVVSLHENSDDVRFRAAKQDYVRYRTIPAGPPDMVEGTMPGRSCDGTTALLPALVDPNDINACNGVRQWNMAHGFATRTSEDYRDAYQSPIVCIEQYAKQGPERVKAFFNMLREEFVNHGGENFEANLRYLTVKYAESNLSMVGSATHFNPTENGWEAPPDQLISIPRLERYRQYLLGVEDSGIESDLDVLEIMIPRRDWFAAVADDIIRTNGPQVNIVVKPYEDPRSPYFGRASHEYKNIRAIFDEEPMKGYFRATGAGTYEFVEVYPWRNVRGETIQGAVDGGGLVAERNPDYWRDTIVCNGVTYRMVSFAWYVSAKAFERYRISESLAPAGVNQVGNNFEVEIRKDADVPCNPLHNQFFMIAQHKFRFKIKYPKLAGVIAYLPEPQDVGYVRLPCSDTTADTAPDTPATYDTLAVVGPDLCEQNNCETCQPGTVANDIGSCVADADGTLEMIPCGTATVVLLDGAVNLVIKVQRNGNTKDAAGVNYATADGSGTAGVNYTNTSGSLSWAADEGGYKTITVPVIAADSAVDKTFTVTLSGASGGASLGTCTVLTVTIPPSGE